MKMLESFPLASFYTHKKTPAFIIYFDAGHDASCVLVLHKQTHTDTLSLQEKWLFRGFGYLGDFSRIRGFSAIPG